MAGIWNIWKNDNSGEIMHSFAIVTTTANELIQKIGHPRIPVILDYRQEKHWLNNDTSIGEITQMLIPYDASLMNAFPIDPSIKNPKANDKKFIEPIGERLQPEFEFKPVQKFIERGFGHGKGRNIKKD